MRCAIKSLRVKHMYRYFVLSLFPVTELAFFAVYRDLSCNRMTKSDRALARVCRFGLAFCRFAQSTPQ